MRILITGGAGFIGSYLSDAYIERGDTVHVIDDLSTGNIHNIAHLKKHPKFSYTIDTVQTCPPPAPFDMLPRLQMNNSGETLKNVASALM